MATMPSIMFNRLLVKQHRSRASTSVAQDGFLFREGAGRLAERLEDTTRQFPLALDLGCHTGQLAQALQGRGGIQLLVQCDLSHAMVQQTDGLKLVADEEALPFQEESFDVVLSALSLHWVNDFPGTLVQIRKVLKPGGVLFASLLGGRTLTELRQAAFAAEMALGQGISPRVSPCVDVKDAGALLQRAGFSMPVTDTDTLTVLYSDAFALFRDLHAMGENNALMQQRKQFTPRTALVAIAEKYQEMFANAEGEIPATFEIVTMTGMKT